MNFRFGTWGFMMNLWRQQQPPELCQPGGCCLLAGCLQVLSIPRQQRKIPRAVSVMLWEVGLHLPDLDGKDSQ